MIDRSLRSRARKNVTLRDVAARAGVSPKTVSNVVNGWPYITDETRQKVLDAVDALGYRPSALARSLVTGRTKSIGVVIPDLTNPFFGQTVRGAEDALYAAGYSIFLCNTTEDTAKERAYLDMLIGRGVDGILMFGARSNSETLSDVLRGHVPLVAEDAPAQHSNSTIIASNTPFTPPIAAMLPVNAAFASVVGLPSASNAQPAGIGLPSLAATMILPRATSVSDRSIISGGFPRRGNTAAIGLVPNSGLLPPQALIAAGEFVKPIPIRPASASGARWKSIAPQ
jgi:LacI family transcriptional regulator